MPEFLLSDSYSPIRVYQNKKPILAQAVPERPRSELLQLIHSGIVDTIGKKTLAEKGWKVRSQGMGPYAIYRFVPLGSILTLEESRHYTDIKDFPQGAKCYIQYKNSSFHLWLVLENYEGALMKLCEKEVVL